MGSTLKEKNLLLEEQILSFKSWPKLKREVTQDLSVHRIACLTAQKNNFDVKTLKCDAHPKANADVNMRVITIASCTFVQVG